MLKKVLIVLALLVGLLLLLGIFSYQNFKPKYSGSKQLQGLSAEVDVLYDAHGIPHIYAQTEEDAFYAMGFVHAQDRLFQMELLRRVPSGRLSEIFGEEMLETDKFFRTIGIAQQADKAVAEYWKKPYEEDWQKAALAYMNGINAFINTGPKPLEFVLLGFEPEPFDIKDFYLGMGFTSFGFAEGFREDPLLTALHHKLGSDYLHDLILGWDKNAVTIPVFPDSVGDLFVNISSTAQNILAALPVAPWSGSNGWVIGPSKSANGKPLFCNDTHMGFSQPSVWYEAYLEAPGLSYYGNFVAGSPFPYLGHGRFAAIGLTMFENDDTDFYVLKPDESDPMRYWYGDEKLPFELRNEIIKVKDAMEVSLEVKTSKFGPVINQVMPAIEAFEQFPVAVSWAYTQLPSTNLQATYRILKATSMEDVRQGVSQINAPGLNVMYADVEGNIAWWTSAKLWLRPEGQSGKFFVDGSMPGNAPHGFLPFDQNPHAVNPPNGFVYSANNQPEGFDGSFYPGYYVPENRAKRITSLLVQEDNWDVNKLEKMIADVHGDEDRELAHALLNWIEPQNALEMEALSQLKNWEGEYQLESKGGVIFQKWIYLIQKMAMIDEMGEEMFSTYMGTHLQKRTQVPLLLNDSSIWWNDIHTTQKESRKDILNKAFSEGIAQLKTQLGEDISGWAWGKVHTVEHPHPFGKVESLRPYFNVAKTPIFGSNEVINNIGFKLNESGIYDASFGPAMRRIIDMSNPAKSQSVLPTGQSGNVLSPYYKDQAALYNVGKFRPQLMDKADVEAGTHKILRLKP